MMEGVSFSEGRGSLSVLVVERVSRVSSEVLSCYAVIQSLTADSTVLAHVLTLLNNRYDYGLDLYLLSIDEGIKGYRDDSLEVSVPS